MAPSALLLLFSMFFFTTPVRSEEPCTTGECSAGNTAGLSLVQSPAARARALHKVQAHDLDAEDVDSQRKEENQEVDAELQEDRDEAVPVEGHEDHLASLAEKDEHEEDHFASLAEEDEQEENKRRRRRRRRKKPPRRCIESSGDTCNPCEVCDEQPKGKLQLDIFTPAANQANAGKASPVVLVFHGRGGFLTDMHNVCQELVVPAGFVCATVDKLGGEFLEGAIRYLIEHAGTYGVDPDNFFAYGFSLGGYSALKFMMMESDVASKLKGVVSDGSAPGKVADFEKKDSNGKYLRIPAYLMIHCDVDTAMAPSWTVDTSEKMLTRANNERDKDEQIQWQSMRFSKATGCKHEMLIMKSSMAAEAMLSFIQSVLAGAEPFPNTNIPKKVTCKHCAKK